jgi:hypothetical protein
VPSDERHGARDAFAAAAGYLALTIALTWPLARGLARDVPSDLGDPLLNCWIMSRDADHLLQAAGGNLGALRDYWQANIYYPHPYALAYSEHLTAQALQILPAYALTKNPLLCYNLIFLSTFVLSGLGMYLLAREFTSNRAAAFVAGVAYAFAPYRFGSLPHLQVLSSAWMPFVLLGLRRFFETNRVSHLVVAAAAWIAQNLSCSYYLIFFSPVVVLYVMWELATRRRWRDARTLALLAATVGIVVIAAVPFVLPYLRLRQLGFMPRSLSETDRFGADVYAYLTTDANLRIWGGVMDAWPKAEGWLFPGVTIVVLAGMAVVAAWKDARLKPMDARLKPKDARLKPKDARLKPRATREDGELVARGFSRAMAVALIICAVFTVAVLFGWSLRLPFAKITNFERLLLFTIAFGALLLATSPVARATARAWISQPVGILTLLTVFAVAMSFGPHIHSRGKLIEDANVYLLFYNYVPGFDGLRVPARFGMIVAFGLALLAGYGVRAFDEGKRVAVIATALIVVESVAVPVSLNGNDTNYKQPNLSPLPPSVGATIDAAPPVYRFIAGLPPSAAVLELPFGEVAFEVRYVFYSVFHRRPIVNGYSGGAPAEYGLLAEALKDLFHDPERAWSALASSGATHVVVHEGGYLDDAGATVTSWIRAHGSRELASFGTDRVFEVPRVR